MFKVLSSSLLAFICLTCCSVKHEFATPNTSSTLAQQNQQILPSEVSLAQEQWAKCIVEIGKVKNDKV